MRLSFLRLFFAPKAPDGTISDMHQNPQRPLPQGKALNFLPKRIRSDSGNPLKTRRFPYLHDRMPAAPCPTDAREEYTPPFDLEGV